MTRYSIRFGIPGSLLIGAIVSQLPALAAPQVINVCGRDDAPGGLNLSTALATGGQFVIRCPAGSDTIQITRTQIVPGIVQLDGEGKITLRGPVAGPLFAVAISLRLAGLTVENPRDASTAGAPGAGTIVSGPKANIELENVNTQNSVSPYTARGVTATNCKFVNNGDPAAQQVNTGIINADQVELRHVTFAGNFEHPLAGDSPPEPGQLALSHKVLIEDSNFDGNGFSLLVSDAQVTIRRTKFQNNGKPPEQSGTAWDCCGGAVTLVRSDASLSKTEFRGNGTSGFGGAIYAIGSRLQIADSIFDSNKARAGGAITFWGQWPKVNIWSTGDWPETPQLKLRRTQFLRNSATLSGGGLLFAGLVDADSVLYRANVSGGPGGAIADWRATTFPSPYDGVFDALTEESQSTQRDAITLARAILVDNVASARGVAVAAGSASVAIGNGLIARQVAKAGSGSGSGGTLSGVGSVTAPKLSLVNTTIADNSAGGVVQPAGSTTRLGNSILLRNAGMNCSNAGSLSVAGRNFQSPGTDCSASVEARDPGLDGQYSPNIISAARGAGDVGLCAADPQVRGVDLFSNARLNGGKCDVGAIERPLLDNLSSAIGAGSGPRGVSRFIWLLFLLAILLFLLALFWASRRRRRYSRPRPA